MDIMYYIYVLCSPFLSASLDLVTDLENALSHLITMGINHLMQQPSFEVILNFVLLCDYLCMHVLNFLFPFCCASYL